MRKRILSAIVALGMVFGIGGYTLTHASAAPVVKAAATTNFGPGTVPGALVSIPATATRGNYLDQNGVTHCLPAGPNSTTLWQTGDYPNMSWHGTNPTCAAGSTGSGLTQAQIQALIDAAVAKAGTGSAIGKHKVVTFNADWATNADVKQLKKCPTIKLPAIPSSTINGQFLDETTVSYGAEKKDTSVVASAPNGRYCFAVLSEGLPKYSAGQPEQWNSNVSDTTMASESDVTVLGEVTPANGVTSRTFVVSINAAPTDPAAPGTIAAFSNSRSFTADFSTLTF